MRNSSSAFPSWNTRKAPTNKSRWKFVKLLQNIVPQRKQNVFHKLNKTCIGAININFIIHVARFIHGLLTRCKSDLSHKGKLSRCYGDYNGMFKILYETSYLCNLATTVRCIFGSLNNFVHKLFFHDRTILKCALRIMNALQLYQILQSWESCGLTRITIHYVIVYAPGH